MRRTFLVIIIVVLFSTFKHSIAQSDSLLFNDGDIILGNVESMEKGVLEFSTNYSDNDFEIEWDEVDKIYTSNSFFIEFKKGKPLYGTINSISDTVVQISITDSLKFICSINEIVHILPYSNGFKDRFEAEINVGFGTAKSNNLRKLSIGIRAGYNAKRWRTFFSYSNNRSRQDEVDPINRSDANLTFEHVIYEDWYYVPSINYLSNTEQQLNYRVNTQLGIGNYIIRSNYAFWGLKAGINRNREDFQNDADDRNSWEGYFGTTADLFDVGDFSLFFSALAYPGITEKGRWRLDGILNVKYDLPLDFYIKVELAANYDNSSNAGGSELDYVTFIGFGWEW